MLSPVAILLRRNASLGMRSSTGERLLPLLNCRNGGSSAPLAFAAAAAAALPQHVMSVLRRSTDSRKGRVPSSRGMGPLMRVFDMSSTCRPSIHLRACACACGGRG
jgi:hypothetical protein